MTETVNLPSALLRSHYSPPTNISQMDRERPMPYQAPPMETPYTVMTLQANEAPRRDNIFATLFSWLTLAGFVVFPGTFDSVRASRSLEDSESGKIVQGAIQHLPLLPFASLCCLVGIAGTIWLWRRWRKNYVWLVGRLFMPGLLHSIVGLINTLISVYTAHDGQWSTTAIFTVTVIGLCLVSMAMLSLVYNNWLLERIKTPYDRELGKHTLRREEQ